MDSSWYAIDNVAELFTPGLVVYPDRVQANIQRMISYAGGVDRLRPHVKTHKMAEVIQMQLAAGIHKFKVATFPEAEMVASCGGADVMLAYPLVGPNVQRFSRLLAMYPGTKFLTVADDLHAVQKLSEVLSQAGQSAEVMLEIDDGMHRTGIAPGESAIELYRAFAQLPGLTPGGFHVYDGHIRDQDLNQRIQHAEQDFSAVSQMRAKLEQEGLSVPRLVCGGTPTFPVHARQDGRELSPGTCVFWDVSYATKFPDLSFEPAALVISRIISKPSSNRLCLDLGYKAISSDNPDPRVKLLQVPDARMVNHSEEHLVVETELAGQFNVGDVLFGVPWHICPTCALHQEAVVVHHGTADARWRVMARDRVLAI